MLLFDSIASDLLSGRPSRAALFCPDGTFFPLQAGILRRRRCISSRKPGYFHSKTGAFLLILRLKSRLFRVSTNSVQYDSYWFSSTFCLLSPLPHTCSKKKVLYWERCIKQAIAKYTITYIIYSFFIIYYFQKTYIKIRKKTYFRTLVNQLHYYQQFNTVRNQYENSTNEYENSPVCQHYYFVLINCLQINVLCVTVRKYEKNRDFDKVFCFF